MNPEKIPGTPQQHNRSRKRTIPMLDQTQNRSLDLSSEQELAKNLKTRLQRVWQSLRRLILATDELSRSLDSGLAVECVVSTTEKREQVIRRCAHQQDYRFFDEGCPELQRIISAVMDQQPDKGEIYRKPSELLEVARLIKALPLKIADIEPEQAKHKRAERAALGRCCELYKGRTFTVKVADEDVTINFDAIGKGRTRLYRFTKRTR
jgi:hypothetical protein